VLIKTGDLDQLVKNQVLLVAARGTIPRSHRFDQVFFLSRRSVASSIYHPSLSLGRVTFFMIPEATGCAEYQK
jgi:hypothetical protein